MKNTKYALALILVCSFVAFAQEEQEKARPEKIAVHVFGASDAGINKSFGSKLLVAVAQSGKYAEIGNSGAFHKELENGENGDIEQIAKLAGKHGADVVCVVGMTEVFGDYSIYAWMLRSSDSQILKAVSLDHPLKSLEDIAKASGELAAQLFGLPPPAPPALAAPAVVAPVAKKECASRLNLNEIVSKIQSGFPASLKDCSVTLAKNIALSKSPFGKKTPAPEPKSFMTECAIDGIKQRLPTGADEYVKPVEGFLQNLLNAASAGGALDVKKLSGAIGSMNVMDLINELKAKAANDECMVDEPYEPAAEEEDEGGDDSSGGKKRRILSFGIRAGANLSHWEASYYSYYSSGYGGGGSGEGSYNSIPGFQLGLLLDIAPSSWFHIQPGLAYVQKGAEDGKGYSVDLHYIELPLLLSLKFSAFRVHAGPYFGVCVDGRCDDFDIGVNAGLGFDIGMFYIGVFYEFGLFESYYDYSSYYSSGYSYSREITAHNRTLGFNFGVNL